MQIYQNFQNLPEFNSTSITFGSFDGFHIGHQALISELVCGPSENIVILMPKKNQPASEQLTTISQRIELLGAAGVDNLIILNPEDFWHFSFEEFTENFLLKKLNAETIFLTENTKFGSGNLGNSKSLQKMLKNFSQTSLQIIDQVKIGDIVISSSKIRAALSSGDLAFANRALNRNYFVDGLISHGNHRGREIGFPTANFKYVKQLLPKEAVYSGVFSILDSENKTRLPAMASLGNNPTFNAENQTLEVHILDAKLDLYDHICRFEFVKTLREMKKFDSIDQLVSQLHQDKAKVGPLGLE